LPFVDVTEVRNEAEARIWRHLSGNVNGSFNPIFAG
jgi:hypothetical protein